MDVHVAQINIGTMVAPTDDPSVAEFMDNLERINAIADAAPGFVWRLQTDSRQTPPRSRSSPTR